MILKVGLVMVILIASAIKNAAGGNTIMVIILFAATISIGLLLLLYLAFTQVL